MPPALSGGPNSTLEDLRFTLTDPPKTDEYNLRSPNLGSKSTLGIPASEHNLGGLPGLVVRLRTSSQKYAAVPRRALI